MCLATAAAPTVPTYPAAAPEAGQTAARFDSPMALCHGQCWVGRAPARLRRMTDERDKVPAGPGSRMMECSLLQLTAANLQSRPADFNPAPVAGRPAARRSPSARQTFCLVFRHISYR